MLALEDNEAVAVLDDGLARRVAEMLEIQYTGTLGLLLDAKGANLIPTVEPVLDQLDALRFHLTGDTRAAVLRLAGEL
jgi:predicted nucleic acid-binding protein